jgi:tripartite-type tricarboxylate transporter receptor subunit TctC
MPELCRRHFLYACSAIAMFPGPTRAQEPYPARPVHIVVGFPPGGGQDIVARMMAQWLSDHLGQQVIVENRAGGGGNVGAELVARASGDGYTLLLVGPPNAINATLYDNLNFDFIRDIAPVAGIYRVPLVLVVNPSTPIGTVAELIAYAKANPGKLNMASAGIGSPQHAGGELFKMMTGVDMIHVPYRGTGPALTDMLAGQVQVWFADMASSLQYIKLGKLRALAVTSSTRSPALPDLPCVGDTVPGYEATSWFGIGAPRNTSREIVEKLNKQVDAGLNDPGTVARISDLGGTVLRGSPEDFGTFMSQETEKWGKVVKFAAMKPE